jgi:hypothetical protein
MFVTGKPFQPSLMFVRRVGAYPGGHLKEALLKDRLLALPRNIRLGWKGLQLTNTLAFYEQIVN